MERESIEMADPRAGKTDCEAETGSRLCCETEDEGSGDEPPSTQEASTEEAEGEGRGAATAAGGGGVVTWSSVPDDEWRRRLTLLRIPLAESRRLEVEWEDTLELLERLSRWCSSTTTGRAAFHVAPVTGELSWEPLFGSEARRAWLPHDPLRNGSSASRSS